MSSSCDGQTAELLTSSAELNTIVQRVRTEQSKKATEDKAISVVLEDIVLSERIKVKKKKTMTNYEDSGEADEEDSTSIKAGTSSMAISSESLLSTSYDDLTQSEAHSERHGGKKTGRKKRKINTEKLNRM